MLSIEIVVDILDTYYVTPEELMLQIRDESGKINIMSYQLIQNKIKIKLERANIGECYVSNAIGQNPKGRCIIDFSTHLPLVAFWNERVKMIEGESV